MIHAIDRIQVTAADADEVAGRWLALLGGETVSEDRVLSLNARRLTVAVGDCHVEVLEPLGEGPAGEHLNSQRGGPFAAGFAARDPGLIAAGLERAGVTANAEGTQLFVADAALDVPGLRLVISPTESTEPAGRLTTLYEVTHLTADPVHAAARIAALFELDASCFVPIESEEYGYRGSLTLFDEARLDRIETIHPFDAGKTMGRYFDKFGPSLYMCYAECEDLEALRASLKALVPDDWTGPREGPVDNLFIHPKALGGVMLGVSRTSFAWTWSGKPERVRAPG